MLQKVKLDWKTKGSYRSRVALCKKKNAAGMEMKFQISS